jgi:hypothetical protein
MNIPVNKNCSLASTCANLQQRLLTPDHYHLRLAAYPSDT